MKITEMVTLLKAGYSKAEIDELRKEESTPVETSGETTEDANKDTSGETVGENAEDTDSNDSQEFNPLQAEIEALQETIKEMQKINLQNARQPEVVEKTPLESASDLLFEVISK